jgi:hypothetical protein
VARLVYIGRMCGRATYKLTCERFIIVLQLLALAAPNRAAAQPNTPPETRDPGNSVCRIIEAAAQANALPVDFFTRVIWQESRFRPDVIGPVTRSGQCAQGIAQFMLGTAAERNLLASIPPKRCPNPASFWQSCARSSATSGLRPLPTMPAPNECATFLPAHVTYQRKRATM